VRDEDVLRAGDLLDRVLEDMLAAVFVAGVLTALLSYFAPEGVPEDTVDVVPVKDRGLRLARARAGTRQWWFSGAMGRYTRAETLPGMAAPVRPVHTHHWTISNAVIAGHVINETFEVQPGDNGSKQIYEVRCIGDGLSERRRTDQRLTVVGRGAERWDAGSRYDIPLSTYHSTFVPHQIFAATVIVTGRRTEARPLVLGEASGEASYQYVTEGLTRERWSALLTQLRARLTRSRA
jgi:hypothetical protein